VAVATLATALVTPLSYMCRVADYATSQCSHEWLADAGNSFLPRDAMRKRGLCCRPVSDRSMITMKR